MTPRKRIPIAVVRRVRAAAGEQCGYCLSPQRLVMARHEIDHLVPRNCGGSDDEPNLWLACSTCNGHKAQKTTAVDPETGDTVPLFNPRTQIWAEHFCWSKASFGSSA